MPPPVVLTVAGSDPSGGAGIQADLKTFAAFGVYGTAVVAALTAQNTRGVAAIADVEPAFVGRQLDAVLDDLPVAAVKTGMLACTAVIEVVADRLATRRPTHLVVDPVMVATSGEALLAADAVAALRRLLLPLATLITPNLHEAEVLLGRPVRSRPAMRDAARALVDLGAGAALVKGGHLEHEATDVLWDGRALLELTAPRLAVLAHGTGCTLSAAIASALALGRDLPTAVAAAKDYVTRALAGALRVGHGAAALDHGVRAPH